MQVGRRVRRGSESCSLRSRERYEATGDTKRAIREGIARTGRPITNAALIMIVVFIAFGRILPNIHFSH